MDIFQLISDNSMVFLTAITALIVLYYTKETYLLRKEAQKQNQVQFTPYLSLRNLKEGATFSNLGKGIALNVKADLESILLIPSVGAGEDRGLYEMSKGGSDAFTLYAKELPDKISITYSDVLGNKYKASFQREYPGFGVFRETDQTKVNEFLSPETRRIERV